MQSIKFSHHYTKMPEDVNDTRLLEVIQTSRSALHDDFVNYDTEYDKGWYTLPDGEVIILLLVSYGTFAPYISLWTTIRRWTPEKESYYRALRGQQVKIEVINDESRT